MLPYNDKFGDRSSKKSLSILRLNFWKHSRQSPIGRSDPVCGIKLKSISTTLAFLSIKFPDNLIYISTQRLILSILIHLSMSGRREWEGGGGVGEPRQMWDIWPRLPSLLWVSASPFPIMLTFFGIIWLNKYFFFTLFLWKRNASIIKHFA